MNSSCRSDVKMCCFEFSVAFKVTLNGIHPCTHSPCQEEGAGVYTAPDRGEPRLWAIPPLSVLTPNTSVLNGPLSKPNKQTRGDISFPSD